MTAPYYALFTDIGVAKLANATATDTPLNITAMGVGDANGVMPTPDPSQTSLINECRRAPLNSLSVDPNNVNQIVAEQVLPDDVGGWWIRELGLYDDDGDLIAVGNCPPSYKPLLEEGAGREQVIRIILIVSSDDAVTLKIDPAVVLATREYVDDAIEAHAKSRNHPDATTSEKGFVQLSSATDSEDETKAATPKAVKAVKEIADAAVKTVNTHEPDEHGNVKLGSAADADIQTSRDDITAGHLLVNGGALALRTVLAGPGRAITDFDGLPANSVSFGYSDATHSPGFTGSVLDFSGSSGKYNAQIATQYNGNGNHIAFRTHNGDAAGAWNNWFELFHTGNPPTAAQSGAMPYFSTALSVDLNTLGAYSAAGVHYQSDNGRATTANHYPVAEAGALLVLPSAYGCQQEYTTFSSRRKFIRGLSAAWNGANGPWQDWNELYGPTNPNEIVSTSANSYRIAYGNYGAFWRQDGGNLYLMLTNSGDAHGSYNNLRPFTVNLASGYITMGRLGLTDYTNFDARYGQKNTASLAAGGGWWQDASTGLIMQMGIVNRTGYGTGVTFPRAFPNYCTGVLLTLNMNIGSLSDSDCNIRVLSHNQNGFSYGSNGEPEKTSFWVAFGK